MLAIDHIIIAAKDPVLAAHDFGQKYNVTTVDGGRHTNWGTYNHLAYFSNNCYIEWLGIFDESLAAKSDNPLVQQLVAGLEDHIEGPIQLALRTKQMDDYVNRFRATGVSTTGPIPGSRKKPNNSILEWRMLFIESTKVELLPFLIEWGDVKNIPSDERYLNKQRVNSVGCALDESILKEIYKLETVDQQVKLENAILCLDRNQIEFTLE